MSPTLAPPSQDIIPIECLSPEDWPNHLSDLPNSQVAWAQRHGFEGKPGQVCILPGEEGQIAQVLFGYGSDRKRGRFHIGRLAKELPEGDYELRGNFGSAEEAALGWLLTSYVFDKYKSRSAVSARLVPPPGTDPQRIEVIAAGAARAMDLINTPANDMGPDALEAAFRELGSEFGAEVSVISGDALLSKEFRMIHAVGRASDQAPRLLDLTWGRPDAPKITLVGKGVCFDTGGLNLKPGGSMSLMKKDMGGGANTMALAHMIMGLGLDIRLRLLIPAVENSVSAGAFRPGDVLISRKGLSVEINNTDAEGRLVLADALSLADEEAPEMIVCMATLTGAARVALGPDLMPFYTDDDSLALALHAAGEKVADPIWRMPFWAPYESMIESPVADLDNAPSGGFAGSITAGLFLKRFVEDAGAFVHLDIYGWTPSEKPGRPKGGACQGPRAVLEMLESRYGGDA